jgi:hypothetical protein
MPLNVQSTDSPWEAFRLTSKSPSELYDVLGPSGVDGLVRHALMDCWNALPAGTRTLATWRKRVDEVWARNASAWGRIKKASPAAFFQDMHPAAADGHLRQALILCWMMLPRGRRDMSDVRAVLTGIYERQLAAWEADQRTFTKGPKPARRKPAPRRAAPRPPSPKTRPATRKTARKSRRSR